MGNVQVKWPEADAKLITDWGSVKEQHENRRMSTVLSTILGITETRTNGSDAAGQGALTSEDTSA